MWAQNMTMNYSNKSKQMRNIGWALIPYKIFRNICIPVWHYLYSHFPFLIFLVDVSLAASVVYQKRVVPQVNIETPGQDYGASS